MSVKFLLLLILSVFFGIGFIALGVYFLSERFLQKLNEAVSLDEKKKKHNSFRAKGSGYMAIGIGALTLMFAVLIFLMPQIVTLLALVYMIILILGFTTLIFVFK